MDEEALELHYYLKGHSHSMDAMVRNRCEREALAVLFEIAKNLNASISVESLAYQEGGLREIWKAIGKNDKQLTLMVAIFAILFSCQHSGDTELTDLEKQQKHLEIEKLQLEIDVIKSKPSALSVEETAEARRLALILESNGKVSVRRSNFYKQLHAYEKVTAISFTRSLSLHDETNESIVPRSDFSSFILVSDKLPVETDENALIEVFSPVLIEGGYHWRGFYAGMPIAFVMLDKEFKAEVLAKQVKFQNGTRLKCVLNIHRKYDEMGEIIVTGYSVDTVLEVSEGGTTYLETLQGNRRRRSKQQSDQRGLFD